MNRIYANLAHRLNPPTPNPPSLPYQGGIVGLAYQGETVVRGTYERAA